MVSFSGNREQMGILECIELGLGANEEWVESLWVRIKGQAHKGDITVGVYHRPLDQEEEIDEAFYRQLQAASQSQALVLMGDFNHPDISWEDHTFQQSELNSCWIKIFPEQYHCGNTTGQQDMPVARQTGRSKATEQGKNHRIPSGLLCRNRQVIKLKLYKLTSQD